MSATDLLLEYEGDPEALDRTLTSMPISAALLGGPDYAERGAGEPHSYVRHEGHYVARCFGPSDAFKFFVESQGYCKVIRALDELL